MQSTPLAVLVYLCLAIGVANAKPECKKDMHKLSAAQSLFVDCAIVNAVPVKLCQGCKDQYDKMIDAYNNITQNCSEIYFNQDRIAVMATMQNVLKGVWMKGYCDDCFKNDNTTDIFNELSTNVTTCFKLYNTTEGHVCTKCMDEYMDLNSFYIKLDQHNDGKVCYDMQDQMNRTRLIWSKEFKCCKREKNMTLFLVVTGIIALIPIFFYGGAFLLTKRSERNHGLLNEQTPELNAPSTSALIAAAVIATPPPAVPPAPVVKKTALKSFNESTDTDSDTDVPLVGAAKHKKH